MSRKNPRIKAGGRKKVLVNKDKEIAHPRPDKTQGWKASVFPEANIKLQDKLLSCSLSEATGFAAGRVSADLRTKIDTSEDAGRSSLPKLYEVILAVLAAPSARRSVILQALGCKATPDRVVTSITSGFFTVPDRGLEGEKARKLAQNRLSTYGRAIEGALLIGVRSGELANRLKDSGGIEGLAEIARAAARLARKAPGEPALHSEPWTSDAGDQTNVGLIVPQPALASQGCTPLPARGGSDGPETFHVTEHDVTAQLLVELNRGIRVQWDKPDSKVVCVIDRTNTLPSIVAVIAAPVGRRKTDQALLRAMRDAYLSSSKRGKGE